MMTMIFLTNVLTCTLFSLTDNTRQLLLTAPCSRPFLLIYYCIHSQNTCRQWSHSVYHNFSPPSITQLNALLITILICLIQILTLVTFLVNARLFSFKKDRNLRTFLVKGTLPSNKEPGTFRCSRKRCLTQFSNKLVTLRVRTLKKHLVCATKERNN